jgi:hypothetical protein
LKTAGKTHRRANRQLAAPFFHRRLITPISSLNPPPPLSAPSRPQYALKNNGVGVIVASPTTTGRRLQQTTTTISLGPGVTVPLEEIYLLAK